jgi:Cell Wall Hydrolase
MANYFDRFDPVPGAAAETGDPPGPQLGSREHFEDTFGAVSNPDVRGADERVRFASRPLARDFTDVESYGEPMSFDHVASPQPMSRNPGRLEPVAASWLRDARAQVDDAARFRSRSATGTSARPLSDADRDLLIRTVYGEAGNQPDDGAAAVAHVVLNRVRSGRFGRGIPGVVLARNQFEPWQRRRDELERLDPNSRAYRRAERIVDGVLSGEMPDQTGGAVYFLNPAIVRQRRPANDLPPWASGYEVQIGDHVFYGGRPPAGDEGTSNGP